MALLLLLLSRGLQADILSPCPEEEGKKAIYGSVCGEIRLPENPEAPDGKYLDIHVLRIPSIQPSEKPPVFFIAGGPGQSSTSLATQYRYQFKDVLADHDFIFVDQRGTGKSNALECDIDLVPHLDKSPDDIESILLKNQHQCLSKIDADLKFYTTVDAVRDLEAVRKTLGYNTLFLWGGSYGSRVVLEYMRSYPNAIAGAIMDGLAPVAISIPTFTERDASNALDKILSHCERSASCSRAFPYLRNRWMAALDALEDTPIKIELKHPRTDRLHLVYIDEQVISSWMHFVLYSRDVAPLLPLIMHQSADGDFSTLFSIIAIGSEQTGEQISEIMHTAVLCAEDYQHAKRVKKRPMPFSRLLRLPSNSRFSEFCTRFPVGHVEEAYFSMPQRDVPTLLLSGELDPITPPRWAELTAQTLSEHQHVVAPGGHHIVSGLGCVTRIIENFIDNPISVRGLDAKCADKVRKADFFIDKAGPQMEAEK